MKRQNGFTLIELVVVIIILGILAVTAAPKFIDLSDDANAAVLSGIQGAIGSANTMKIADTQGTELVATQADFDTYLDLSDDISFSFGTTTGGTVADGTAVAQFTAGTDTLLYCGSLNFGATDCGTFTTP